MDGSAFRWRAALAAALAIGCGEGAPPATLDAGNLDAASADVGARDAPGESGSAPRPECVGGDRVCRRSCVLEDPDCVPTPGDGVCVGNAGELCTRDNDCRTREDVCGNGECSASEDSDLCYADCGPTPWPWAEQEAALLAAVNERRARGIACDGGAAVTLGPLTLDVGAQRVARERAWELSFAGQSAAGGSCNGRSPWEIVVSAGVSSPPAGLLQSRGNAGSQLSEVVEIWVAAPTLCPFLINPMITRITPAVARPDGAPHAFVLIVH